MFSCLASLAYEILKYLAIKNLLRYIPQFIYYHRGTEITEMNRNRMLEQLRAISQWDFIVIGGGASGLGTAVDAASRGYSTLLLEQGDFAQGTSSRSTKLIHGGIRYLPQGKFLFVRKALQERMLLVQNAPH